MLPTARDRQERSLLLIQTLADLLGDLSPSVLGRRAMERAAGSANHHSPAVVGPFLHCRSSPAPPPPTGVGAGHDLIQGVSEQVTHHQHHHTHRLLTGTDKGAAKPDVGEGRGEEGWKCFHPGLPLKPPRCTTSSYKAVAAQGS